MSAGSRATLDRKENIMQISYKLYHRYLNEYEIQRNVAVLLKGWEMGQQLIEGFDGTIEIDSVEDENTVPEKIFHKHNMDDRPDGQSAPSLSVGDVVLIKGDDGQVAWTVEGMGWRRLDLEEMHEVQIHDGSTAPDSGWTTINVINQLREEGL
jgi:hypothetical protein